MPATMHYHIWSSYYYGATVAAGVDDCLLMGRDYTERYGNERCYPKADGRAFFAAGGFNHGARFATEAAAQHWYNTHGKHRPGAFLRIEKCDRLSCDGEEVSEQKETARG